MLQPTGPGGVVIDAQIVDDQAEAGCSALADADRAQEAVLQRDIGLAVLRRPASACFAVGFMPQPRTASIDDPGRADRS
jgi:hypothetical protein